MMSYPVSNVQKKHKMINSAPYISEQMRWQCVWSPGGRSPVRKRAKLVLLTSMLAFAYHSVGGITCFESLPQRQKPDWCLVSILEPTVAESCSKLQYSHVPLPLSPTQAEHSWGSRVVSSSSSANPEGGLDSHVETSEPPSSLPSSHLWGLEMPPRGGSRKDRAACGVGGVPGGQGTQWSCRRLLRSAHCAACWA